MGRIRQIAFVIAGSAAASGPAPAADFDCVIQPRQVLEMRSPIEGLIERISVERGDFVRKGQEIASVDTSVERVLAEIAKYRSEMQGTVRAGESKVQLSGKRVERAKELFREDYVSAQVQDDAVNEKQLAEAELLEARDNRKLAELEYKRQMTVIRLKSIRSPVNGVVMERILNPGELVEAGVGRKPILKLAEIERLYVETLLPAEAYRQVKMGMEAEVTPEVPSGTTGTGKVAVIDRVLDPASGTFGVRLELPNPRGELLAGVRCRVKFANVSVAARPSSSARDGEPRPARPAAAPPAVTAPATGAPAAAPAKR